MTPEERAAFARELRSFFQGGLSAEQIIDKLAGDESVFGQYLNLSGYERGYNDCYAEWQSEKYEQENT